MRLVPLLLALQAGGDAPDATPVLEFPEPGLDDPAAYEGYRTRLFRDSRGNTVQIYLDARSGRVVHLWADALNESVGLTVRDLSGRPATLAWGEGAVAFDSGGRRFVQHDLVLEGGAADIGWFLLGSMRVERDFQYAGRHRDPFEPTPFREPELVELVTNLARLDSAERRRHLALLRAPSLSSLRARLAPTVMHSSGAARAVRVERPSLDGRHRLTLELAVPRRTAALHVAGQTVRLRPRGSGAVRLTVRIGTDAPALTPLPREAIFSSAFLAYADSVARAGAAGDSAARLRARRLERRLRGVELLTSQEKLMAGLPNFATYFGRDMLVTALLMEPIWAEGMLEHVVGAALAKLGPDGAVSHEEALGGQAIRESAADYNRLLAAYVAQRGGGARTEADSLLAQARAVLAALDATRENYRMVDDDFQLPVVAAHYLADPRVSPERKRAFLDAPARGRRESHVALLLQNLGFVWRAAAPYAERPDATTLVGFPPLEPEGDRWMSASWRDSGAGYGNGRFAMDVNVVWVPEALRATGRILAALDRLGVTAVRPLEHAPDSTLLARALAVWNGTARHFRVSTTAAEARRRVETRLAALAQPDRSYWRTELARLPADTAPVEFLALALDGSGQPIPVANTDVGTRLYLAEGLDVGQAAAEVRIVVLPYPLGLFVGGLGPLVANDAYASPDVWVAFDRDAYHSPRVVWGREVNLLLAGLARRILDAPPEVPETRALRDALRGIRAAVDASGLAHNELWSYRLSGGRLVPVRYGTSSDVQLWNLTDLAVQFALSRIPQ